MSWSVNIVGKPENVAAALTAQSECMEGQSKVEFDSVLPHLVGIVNQNFGQHTPVIKLAASGTGYSANGEQVHRNCSVTLEVFYATIV
jgi:hypothetical protein